MMIVFILLILIDGTLDQVEVQITQLRCSPLFLRWDRAQTDQYYIESRENLYPIFNEMKYTYNATLLLENNNMNSKPEYRSVLNNLIKCWYNRTVRVLHSAAMSNVPVIPRISLKPWWTSELTDCKK